jgi:hypothetical protein
MVSYFILTVQLWIFYVWLILAGFAPNDHHNFPANVAHSSAESLAETTASPSMSTLPKCSSSLAGDSSGGVHTFHTKINFQGNLF